MGDVSVDLLRRLLRDHRGLAPDGETFVAIGLVGRGIQSSRTPGMHEREARRLGICCSYILIDFDGLNLPDEVIGDLVRAAPQAGFRGLNVTHPFKQSILPSLDRLSDDARAIGAVNTVVFDGQGSVGHNTDSWGFAEGFREAMAGAALDRVALFGAGGAGAAVAFALLGLGVQDLAIVEIDTARGQRLAERLTATFPARVEASSDAGQAVKRASGVVNSTPIGMAKYPGSPFDPDLLTADQWVADIVYFPARTALLVAADARGCRTLPGIGMAINQAVRAFELFTGRKADRRTMADHFEAAA